MEAKTLSDMAAKARADVTKAEVAASRLEAVAAAWPADRPVKSAFDVGSQVSIAAEVESREAAAAYLEGFELEPLAYAKGTFTTVKPLAWFKPGEVEAAAEAVTSDLMPAVWKFDHGKAELHAWPKVAGVRVHLKLEIRQDPARQVVEYDRPERRDRRVIKDELHGAPQGEAIRWHGAGHPRSYSVWFYQEPGGGAPTLADLLAQRGRVI